MKTLSDADLHVHTYHSPCWHMEVNRELLADASYLRPISRFYAICRRVGVRFTLGSDAHSLPGLAPSAAALAGLGSLGFERRDFLTADELVSRS